MRSRLTLLFLAMLVSAGAWAQNDPVVGTWKMNLAESKFSPGPPPKSPTIAKIEAVEGGIRIVTDGVNAGGKATHTDATVGFDGKKYPRDAKAGGKPDNTTYDFMAIQKVDAYNYQIREMAGQAHELFGDVHWTISPDGKTRTVTGTGKNAQGQTSNNVIVWDKQ